MTRIGRSTLLGRARQDRRGIGYPRSSNRSQRFDFGPRSRREADHRHPSLDGAWDSPHRSLRSIGFAQLGYAHVPHLDDCVLSLLPSAGSDGHTRTMCMSCRRVETRNDAPWRFATTCAITLTPLAPVCGSQTSAGAPVHRQRISRLDRRMQTRRPRSLAASRSAQLAKRAIRAGSEPVAARRASPRGRLRESSASASAMRATDSGERRGARRPSRAAAWIASPSRSGGSATSSARCARRSAAARGAAAPRDRAAAPPGEARDPQASRCTSFAASSCAAKTARTAASGSGDARPRRGRARARDAASSTAPRARAPRAGAPPALRGGDERHQREPLVDRRDERRERRRDAARRPLAELLAAQRASVPSASRASSQRSRSAASAGRSARTR